MARSNLMFRIILIALTAAAIPLSFIAAPFPRQLVLQHVPTLIGIGLLALAVKRFRPSTASLICCLIFLWLHIIGARWIYTYVPYDDVSQAIFGRTLSETFGWHRNHYDRLVHFASGVLGMPPLAEAVRSFGRTPPVAAAVLAMSCVLAIGAAYEILEWQIAMLFSPAMAESYNG